MSTISPPKKFKDLATKAPAVNAFEGQKIEPHQLFGIEITVHKYSIGPSTLPGKQDTKCLTLQITLDGIKRIVFSGSKYLMDQCEQLDPVSDFPFTATIVRKENRSHQFT
jgi:hypothetical protein